MSVDALIKKNKKIKIIFFNRVPPLLFSRSQATAECNNNNNNNIVARNYSVRRSPCAYQCDGASSETASGHTRPKDAWHFSGQLHQLVQLLARHLEIVSVKNERTIKPKHCLRCKASRCRHWRCTQLITEGPQRRTTCDIQLLPKQTWSVLWVGHNCSRG